MSYVLLRQAIEGRFKTNWTYTPIQWPNTFFDPNDPKYLGQDIYPGTDFVPGKDWVRLAINTGAKPHVGVGNPPLKRLSGVIAVSIFVPFNKGSETIDLHVDRVETIFGDQSFNGVICRATEKVNVGKTESWLQVNANTFFNYDEI